jgi:predicted small metal-binding protein
MTFAAPSDRSGERGSDVFRRPFAELSPAYDEDVKQIPCVCGRVVTGEDDDELWRNAQEHIREDHPDLVDKVTRDDLLAQAEEVP